MLSTNRNIFWALEYLRNPSGQHHTVCNDASCQATCAKSAPHIPCALQPTLFPYMYFSKGPFSSEPLIPSWGFLGGESSEAATCACVITRQTDPCKGEDKSSQRPFFAELDPSTCKRATPGGEVQGDGTTPSSVSLSSTHDSCPHNNTACQKGHISQPCGLVINWLIQVYKAIRRLLSGLELGIPESCSLKIFFSVIPNTYLI